MASNSRSSHRCEPRTALNATHSVPTWCSVHRMRADGMRRAFSDLIAESYMPAELEYLDGLVEAAMLPEDEDGRWVMDEDPWTLSDWNYKTPTPPKTSLIRNPFSPPIGPGYEDEELDD